MPLALVVVMVDNGKLALEASESGTFDIILMDIQMPEMDGVEAAQHIRKREQANGARPIPILALSAHAFSEERDRCLACGMDAYIPKPIDRAVLLSTLQQYPVRSSTTS